MLLNCTDFESKANTLFKNGKHLACVEYLLGPDGSPDAGGSPGPPSSWPATQVSSKLRLKLKERHLKDLSFLFLFHFL